jgi:hypothetical protein
MKNFSREKATVIFLAVFFICFVVLSLSSCGRPYQPFAYKKSGTSKKPVNTNKILIMMA